MDFHKIYGSFAAQCDDGFTVDRVGSPLTRYFLRYQEADHVVEHPLKPPSKAKIAISVAQIGWNPPHHREPLSFDDRLKIARRMCAALTFLGAESYVTD